MVDKSLVQVMRVEVLQAIKAIAARHGLNVEQQRNVTYFDDHFSVKYTFSDANVDIKRNEFNKVAWKFGFQEKHYGLTFQDGSDSITIIGINTRARKYPINFTKNGKPMKMGAELMKIKMLKAGVS